MHKDFLRQVGAIYRILNSFSDYILKALALEKGQYQFLVRVKETPGINQQKLSDILYVSKSTTAKAVKKLIVKGYLSREVSDKDKRNYQLYLTEKGEEVCAFLALEEKYATAISLDGIKEEEVQFLIQGLEKVKTNVEPLFEALKTQDREEILQDIHAIDSEG